jgi:hypothetical protein
VAATRFPGRRERRDLLALPNNLNFARIFSLNKKHFMKKSERIVSKNSVAAGNDGDVSPEERRLLAETARTTPGSDDEAIHRASLDETDEDGTPLEEKGLDQDLAGNDLDVPGADDDDDDEKIGEEDEENNEYSLGGDNHDDDEHDD